MDGQDLIQLFDEAETQNERSDPQSGEGSLPSLGSEVSSTGDSSADCNDRPVSATSFDTSSASLPRLLETDFSSLKTNKEFILDELLSDIRRSCATSLASTPTAVSFSDGETSEAFLDCKVRRSEAELRTLDVAELKDLVSSLQSEVECSSSLLIKLLQAKDRHALRATKLSDKMSSILRNYARRNKLTRTLSFSQHPPSAHDGYKQWLNSWKVMSRLPKGIPKMWRKEVWEGLIGRSEVSSLDWPSIYATTFSEYATPKDDALGSQIVKDLHRTGDTGFTSEEEHAVLKRVLLAYARFNQSTGYCQGFNILAALILKVVDFDDRLALKVMVHLVDYVLPDCYFAQNLHALSADMAAFRELLRHMLPELSAHIETLQKEASGTVKKSYSNEDPPDIHSIHAYEPPLVDVFSMQWFLTVFASALPRKATRRVWDMILLEGSEALLYTGSAIMAIMEKDLLQTATAADFYATMARLGECLRKSQLLPSSEFMEVIYTVQSCVCSSSSYSSSSSSSSSVPSIPSVQQLREKYAYNILPCARPEDDEMAQLLSKARPCPLPMQGGSFAMTSHWKDKDDRIGSKKKRKKKVKGGKGRTRDDEIRGLGWSGQKSPALPKEKLISFPLEDQVLLLRQHYFTTSRQPPTIRCNIDLAPPMARMVCPQTKYKSMEVSRKQMGGVYGPDVPDSVIQRSKALCGHPVLESFTRHKDRAFVVSSEYPTVGDNGLEIDGAWFREGSRDRKNSSGFEGKSVAFNNMDDLMSKKFHKSQQRHMISAS